jgi:hypothetical protein
LRGYRSAADVFVERISLIDAKAFAVAKGFDGKTIDRITPETYSQMLEAVPPALSSQIATAICSIIGRISLENNGQGVDSFFRENRQELGNKRVKGARDTQEDINSGGPK